ncbi:helix-turn-helix transcriptional regulator [Zymomonas mobilis]|uniref:helix-turn-helix transcriptional regulator n=1 Tax=Zymomonas mobilis TaxID=542 RepID=UPI003EB87E7B
METMVVFIQIILLIKNIYSIFLFCIFFSTNGKGTLRSASSAGVLKSTPSVSGTLQTADPPPRFAMARCHDRQPPNPTGGPIMLDPKTGLPPRFLRTPDAARFLGISIRTLEKHRTYGTGPTYRKIGGRIVYTLDDL